MNLNEDYDMIVKIILIGDSGVGKTNILSQYLKKQFNQDSLATVGVEFGSKIVEIEKVKIKAQIWDTAGQERYRSITTSYYKGAKGAFIVYDVTRFSSFETVCEEMEGFAVYSVAEKFKVPVIGFRVISNNELTGEKYDTKYGECSQEFTYCFVKRFINEYEKGFSRKRRERNDRGIK